GGPRPAAPRRSPGRSRRPTRAATRRPQAPAGTPTDAGRSHEDANQPKRTTPRIYSVGGGPTSAPVGAGVDADQRPDRHLRPPRSADRLAVTPAGRECVDTSGVR